MVEERRRAGRDAERAIRIGDVAREAGVSIATVSRTLSAPQQVREVTRARVLEAVRRLGYTPNAAARNLRAGTTRMILVVVPRRANPPFFSEVLRGIDAQLTQAGYSLIMGNLEDRDAARDRQLLDLVYAGHLDGGLILSHDVPAADGRSVLDAAIPFVAVCVAFDVEGIPSVLIDDHGCMVRSTQHLIDLGHRRFVYLAGPEGNYSEVTRYPGFLESISKAELGPQDVVRLPGDFQLGSGIAAAEAYLALPSPRPTGVVCCNDEMAIAFMKAVKRAGVRVPEEVSIVGFDGIEFTEFCEPTLTTIQQPRFELGATGARMLLDMIQGSRTAEAGHVVLDADLVVRDSTGPAP